MQKLSKLDYELITILTQLDQESPKESTGALIEAKGNSAYPSIVDRTLTRTTEFVNVLKLLVDSCSSTSSALLALRRNDSKHGSKDTRRNSVSSSDSEYDSSGDSGTHYLDSPNESRASTSNQMSCQELDTSSLLSILVVYVRFLRLYLIIFRRIYEHLKELSERGNPQIHSFSVLSISDLPIRKFAMP